MTDSELLRGEKPRRAWLRSWLVPVLMWTSVTCSFWALSVETGQQVVVARDQISVFEFERRLFERSAILVGSAMVVLALAIGRWPLPRPAALLVSLPLMILGFGGLVVSLKPSAVAYTGREYVPSPTVRGQKVFAIPFFFKTADDELSDRDKARLRDLLAVFNTCSAGSIQAQGFASSAPFAPQGDCDSNCRNVRLAQRRAMRVTSFISQESRGAVRATYRAWDDFEEMRDSRRLLDTDGSGRLIAMKERINRRVELTWLQDTCNLGRSGSQQIAPTVGTR